MKDVFLSFLAHTSVFEKIVLFVVVVVLVYLITLRVIEMKNEDFDGRDN